MLTCTLRQGLLFEPESPSLSSLSRLPWGSQLHLPCTGVKGRHPQTPGIYTGTESGNPSLCVCSTRFLPPEPLPSPRMVILSWPFPFLMMCPSFCEARIPSPELVSCCFASQVLSDQLALQPKLLDPESSRGEDLDRRSTERIYP